MGVRTFTVGASFARTPLAEVSAKVAELEALGWHEVARGDPWVVTFEKLVPEGSDPSAEVRAAMGDAWVDADEVIALLDSARSSHP